MFQQNNVGIIIALRSRVKHRFRPTVESKAGMPDSFLPFIEVLL